MDRTQLDQSLGALAKSLGDLAGLNASVVLYGSAARADWVPGRSDVNLLVLLDDTSPNALRRLTPAVTAWHTKGFAPPLIMGLDEWQRSADVFPIEIADMQAAHRVLCGADPVQGHVLRKAPDVRDQQEGTGFSHREESWISTS